ncbi:hypothetical protein Tsubulata_031906, partial [Turnera subulata]
LARTNMVRGKIQMRKIENATSRQVTFSKRRNGLLKKAHELSVLCDAEVAVLIFSQRGRLFEFSSNEYAWKFVVVESNIEVINMQKTIDRYRKYAEVQVDTTSMEQHMQQLKHESAIMAKKIELLEGSKRKLLGQCLDACSIDQLEEIDKQLESSLSTIRARKAQMFKEQIDQLKARERLLLEENGKLSEKCGVEPWSQSAAHKAGPTYLSLSGKSAEVETGLFIGPPPVIRR